MKKKSNSIVVVEFDRVIFLAYICLMVIGIYMMLDINSVRNSMVYFYRQLIYAIASLVLVLFILYRIDLPKIRKLNFVFVIITIALLGLVLWKGSSVKGAQRSLNLGIVNFQPSFLARIVLIVYLSGIIAKKYDQLKKANLKEFIQIFSIPLIITAMVYGLILKGQHLSSLVISAASLICLFFLGGIRFKIILIALGICVILGVAIIKIGADYRSDRLDIYKKYFLLYKGEVPKLSPEKEYQVKESLTALTSGKFFGVGADKGRAKHYYLPEARTDYVFTVIGEEYGFLGAIVVFGLHCLLFFKTMLMANKQEDLYLKLVAMGLSLNIFLNVLVNVGVSMSILPSTGNTLPFISYSGTAMLIDSISVGMILNISAKRKEV
jgi:cell division protein FtsW